MFSSRQIQPVLCSTGFQRRRKEAVCGELLILAECTVEVQTCESFAHG